MKFGKLFPDKQVGNIETLAYLGKLLMIINWRRETAIGINLSDILREKDEWLALDITQSTGGITKKKTLGCCFRS